MAKKAVATLHEGSTDGRAYSKVIKMVKSPKTGAYIFDEHMVPNEAVKDFFKNEYYSYIKHEEAVNPTRFTAFFVYSLQYINYFFYFCK